ncbi:MAG: metallophosphoesterase, partial [Pseudomonas sp.]
MSRIERFAANHQGRDYAVGDIHGHFQRVWAQLMRAGFDPKVDRLFSVGDLVDRGPECTD